MLDKLGQAEHELGGFRGLTARIMAGEFGGRVYLLWKRAGEIAKRWELG